MPDENQREELLRRLGEELHRARRRAGMTIRQLGEVTGVSYAIISRVETGKRSQVTFDVISRLAFALDVDLTQLIQEGYSIDRTIEAAVEALSIHQRRPPRLDYQCCATSISEKAL